MHAGAGGDGLHGESVVAVLAQLREDRVDRLLTLAWWDWPLQHITEHVRTIMSGSIDDLANAASALQ